MEEEKGDEEEDEEEGDEEDGEKGDEETTDVLPHQCLVDGSMSRRCRCCLTSYS